MSTVAIILLTILFCIMQTLFYKKGKKKWMKYLPAAISSIGLAMVGCIYVFSEVLHKTKMISQSVMAENQYFSIWMCVLIAPCLLGSIMGIILPKIFKDKKILFYIPLLIFLTVYLIMMIMGMGLISIRELLWLMCFAVSGLLLNKGILWGGVFGLIPAVSFLIMSVQYTGQILNIERPLGIILIAYYLVCSYAVYRKRII